MNRREGHREGSFRLVAHFHEPPPDLAGCFTSFYRLELDVEGGAQLRDFLQPEWANIRFFCGSMP